MLHFAIVEIQISEYMNDGYSTFIKNHTVEATDQEEATKKIGAFYENKSGSYGTHYSISDINFFEHIE